MTSPHSLKHPPNTITDGIAIITASSINHALEREREREREGRKYSLSTKESYSLTSLSPLFVRGRKVSFRGLGEQNNKGGNKASVTTQKQSINQQILD